MLTNDDTMTQQTGKQNIETTVNRTITRWTREVEIPQASIFWTGFTFFAGGTFGAVLSLCVLSLLAKLFDFIKEMI